MTWSVGRGPRRGAFTGGPGGPGSGSGGSNGPTMPTGVMGPPAGATLLSDLTTAAAWTPEVDGFLTQPAGIGPGGDPVVRSTLQDGQNSNPGTGQTGVERNDVRWGDIPLGSTRHMTWYQRMVQHATGIETAGGYYLLGPCEIHSTSTTLDQAPVQLHLGTGANWHPPGSAGNFMFESNGGSAQHDFVTVGLADIGVWHQVRLSIKFTNDNTGYTELWWDGVKKFGKYNFPTTLEAVPGYGKFGHYRSSEINGTAIFEVSGCRVWKEGSL